MARFARIDSQIRANRFRVPELNPFLANRASNHRFEAICANRSHVAKIVFFLRIDSRESIHANRFMRIAPIRIANRRAI